MLNLNDSINTNQEVDKILFGEEKTTEKQSIVEGKDSLDCVIETAEMMVRSGHLDPHELNNMKTVSLVKDKKRRKEIAEKYLKKFVDVFKKNDKYVNGFHEEICEQNNITEAKNSPVSDKIATQLSKAQEILYKLDKWLSNQYRGDKGPFDKALHRVRFNTVNKATKALDSGNYLGEIKALNEDKE